MVLPDDLLHSMPHDRGNRYQLPPQHLLFIVAGKRGFVYQAFIRARHHVLLGAVHALRANRFQLACESMY